MALKRASELPDGPGEGEVEEQLEPAGAPLIAVMAIGGSQRRLAEMHRVPVSGVNCATGLSCVAGSSRVTGVRHVRADCATFGYSGLRTVVNVGGGHGRRSFLKSWPVMPWHSRRSERVPVIGMGQHSGGASPVRARLARQPQMARSGQAYTNPVRAPQAAAAAREERLSLRRMLARCRCTVCSLRTSRRAMS